MVYAEHLPLDAPLPPPSQHGPFESNTLWQQFVWIAEPRCTASILGELQSYAPWGLATLWGTWGIMVQAPLFREPIETTLFITDWVNLSSTEGILLTPNPVSLSHTRGLASTVRVVLSRRTEICTCLKETNQNSLQYFKSGYFIKSFRIVSSLKSLKIWHHLGQIRSWLFRSDRTRVLYFAPSLH